MASPPASAPSPPALPDDTMDSTTDLDLDLDMALDGAADLKSDENLDATIPEPREPTKKDISLREFVSKMDDYAPIVRSQLPHSHLSISPAKERFKSPPSTSSLSQFSFFLSIFTQSSLSLSPPPLDPRRSNIAPPPPRGPGPLNNPSTLATPPRPRDPKIHRRHRRRRLPVLPDAGVQYILNCPYYHFTHR